MIEEAENRFLSIKEYHRHRDWIQCVLDTSKVIEETTLMRLNIEGDERAYRKHLLGIYLLNEEGHEVNRPHLVSS